jgi:hypothetical protein
MRLRTSNGHKPAIPDSWLERYPPLLEDTSVDWPRFETMPATACRFDLAALYRAIDRRRQECSLSWAALGRQVGVAPSTIRRFEHAVDAEADGVLALFSWCGVAPEEFVVNGPNVGQTLPPASGGMVRADVALMNTFKPDRGTRPARPRVGDRISIQRLVEVAVANDRPIASLTRVTEH